MNHQDQQPDKGILQEFAELSLPQDYGQQNHVSQDYDQQGYGASWLEISKKALLHNIVQYKEVVGFDKQFAVVVKSNAYGHGILEVATVCQQSSLVDWLCVASLSEALLLRHHGITKPILVLSYCDASLEEIILHDIAVVVYDELFLDELQHIAQRLRKIVNIHIKVDTGLSRLGLTPEQVLAMLQRYKQAPYVCIQGIFTHFAESEKVGLSQAGLSRPGNNFTDDQVSRFTNLLEQITSLKIDIPYRHFSCTAAVTMVEDRCYNFARMGLGIYGLWPSEETKQVTHMRYPQFNIQPVMTWKTRIIQVKTVPVGSSIGYGRTFITKRETRLALLPVGYWEGYDRKLSNTAQVIIHGKVAPVLGRVSMNITTVDITDISDVAVGHEVILLGAESVVSANTLAKTIGTINWEVVTRINPSVPRIMVD